VQKTHNISGSCSKSFFGDMMIDLDYGGTKIQLMCKLWLCKRNSNAEVDRGKGKGEAHSLINIYKEPIRLLH